MIAPKNIKAIFEDPKTTTRNPKILAERANVSIKAATSFLQDQHGSQIRKKHRADKSSYVPTGGNRGLYLADVMYLRDYAGLNKKRSCILTLMEVNSRYVYARPMISATSEHTASAFQDMYEQNLGESSAGIIAKIEFIRCDDGPEFSGDFSALLKKLEISIEKGQPNRHARLSRLDRYHGELRKQIGQLFALRNSHVWIDALQDLVKNHNSSPSSVFTALDKDDVAPEEVGPNDEILLMIDDMGKANRIRHKVDKLGIVPGTRVRLLTKMLKNTPRFIKAQESVWTPDIYKVLERVGPNTFRIDVPANENEVWPVHGLQVVNKVLGQQKDAGQKINKKNVKETRQLNLEISEKEREANLAAPSRPRSQRAVRVDYTKMMKK